MARRKSISKKIRYDIFKRDSFRCQYCGRSAPDVILEIDHITPVAEGGGNDAFNLITSCRDCNRGKGKQPLSVNETIKKQKEELDALNIKREQIEMMVQWKEELQKLEGLQLEAIDRLIESLTTEWVMNESGKSTVLSCLKRFSFEEVYEATEISFTAYYLNRKPFGSEYKEARAFAYAIDKIGGICYNRRKQNGSV